jgi:hypothetical protein
MHQSNQRQSHPNKFIQWCWLCRTSLEDRAQYTVWQSQSYPLTCIYKPLQENAIRRFIHWKKLGKIDEYEKRQLSWFFLVTIAEQASGFWYKQLFLTQHMYTNTWFHMIMWIFDCVPPGYTYILIPVRPFCLIPVQICTLQRSFELLSFPNLFRWIFLI